MAADILEAMSRRLGDPRASLERRRRMDENVRFARTGMDRWRRLHPNSWIAVHDERVVAVNGDRDRLIVDFETAGFPLGETFVGFVNAEKRAYFL